MSELAKQLIEENIQTKSFRLDLGRCGLDGTEPELEKLGACDHLETLILSDSRNVFNEEEQRWKTLRSSNKGKKNRLVQLPNQLPPNLKNLFASGHSSSPWKIQHIVPLAPLKQLTQLSMGENQIKDIRPLQNLTKLRSIDLRNNQITDIHPLANLAHLSQLVLRNNQVTDLAPLKNLLQLNILVLRHNQISDVSALENLRQLHTLTLRNNQIVNIWPLQDLLQLKKLYLSSNLIADLEPLESFHQLEELYLNNNKIVDIEPLKHLSKLKQLFLRHNQISDIRPLQDLQQLTELYLGKNHIKDIGVLEKLQQLTILDLNENQISDCQSLGSLKQLIILNIVSNHLTEVESLGRLSELIHLYLSDNQVVDIQSLASLQKLSILKLNDNQVSDIRPLNKLQRLIDLGLGNNQISDVEPLKNLPKLTELNLRNNHIQEISSDFLQSLPQLAFFDILGNPLQNIPPEITGKRPKAILNYLQSIQTKEEQYQLNEAKLILVGVGEVGKTELVEALSNPVYHFKEGRQTTQGIRIKSWQLTDCVKDGETFDFTTHIWDFAGQEINYGTHQFFLTKNSVYLFLWDGRKGEDNSKFDYWLQAIALLSDHSPVFVIQNKVDVYQVEINQQNWKDRFENIIDFKKTSCKNGTGIQDLQASIKNQLISLDHIGEIWNKDRMRVRKILENKEANYISHREYLQICEKYGVNREDAGFLSQQLHDIGIILYFEDDFALRDTVVLNPEWATKAAYKLLDNQKENSPIVEGHFHQNVLTELWDEPSYDGKHSFLLRLMERFELIFQLQGTPEYIIPELLPINTPEPAQNTQPGANPAKYLQLQYHYEFMPKGVFSRFLCRIHERIHEDLYWKYGAVLAHKDSLAKVLWNDTTTIKTIKIEAWGAEADQLMFLIRDELEHIHKKLNNPPLKEKIPCICEECRDSKSPHLYNYLALIKFQKKGRPSVLCEKSADDVSIQALLHGILEEDKQEHMEQLLELINEYRVADFFEMITHLKIKAPQLSVLRRQFIQSKDSFAFTDQLKTWTLDYFNNEA
ncbi:MAG TPA: hypothetical protein DCS93_27240 [Microscillaceae bacterium]|nr:hypothetical protein [Microscillaceae bacterium]